MKFAWYLIGALCANLSGAALAQNAGWPSSLTLGMVPLDNPAETAKGLAPLLRHLEQVLNIPVKLSVGKNYNAVIEGLKSGGLQVAYLGPAAYVQAHAEAGAEAFARENTQRSGTGYFTYLITKSFGPLESLDRLKGRTLAFADPESTSGYLVPMVYFLRERKLEPQSYFGRIEFSGSHEKSILGVMSGKYDVAAVSSLELQKSMDQGQVGKNDLNLLWRSRPIPSQPLAYRKDLPDSLKKALKKAFLEFDDKATLKYLKLTSFVEAVDSDYDGVRELEEVKKSLSK